MSIKNSLRISLTLLTSLPLIILTVLAYTFSYQKYIDLSKSSATDLAETYAEGFESQLNVQIAEIEGLAHANNIQLLALENYNGVTLGGDSAYYQPVTELLHETSAYMQNTISFYIYDINGYFIAGSDATDGSDWAEYMDTPISEITTTTIIKSPKISENGCSIGLITPIMIKNEIVGLMRSDISAEYFRAFIPENGNAFIMTSTGDYLFSSSGLSDNPELETEALDLFKLNQSKGYIQDSSSISNLYGYCRLETIDWMYIILQDGHQFRAILSSLPAILLVTLVIILIISFVISNTLTHKYTTPILSLKQSMMEAAAGHLNVVSDIRSNDEFGQLSDSFNTMMDIISSNYNELSESKKILESNEIELKKNYDHIEMLAYHDGLTGLYNRVAFMKYAYEIFSNAGSKFVKHAVFFIDLDNFKNVNDTLGHDYGDLLLKQVAKHLTACISEDDILARTGGDEFLVFKTSFVNDEELEEFASSLISIVNTPFDLDGESAHVSMSVGIALFPKDGLSLTELIKNADIAMYSAKTSGKNNYRFFDSYMEDDVSKKNELADILTTVIEKNEVYLQYQPQVNVLTGKITGYEALMRIESEEVGFIPPSEFIPIAEDNGTINQLGEWALYEACTFNNRLIDAGFEPLRVSVNISTTQLKDKMLIETIRSIPEKTGMPLKYLEIEITESVLMDSFEHNLGLINQMKQLGATIALDDFGTGYSSFNYLTRIPIDTLKIDKSFIQGICENDKDRYIADSIISLAHKMNISVVAEGVEDVNQLKILQSQFCDTLQGYLFSKPLSATDFIDLLRKTKKQA